MVDPAELSIANARLELEAKKVSAVELVEACITHARAREGDNAFITHTHERAREHAAQWDDTITKGEQLPLLAGIPGALKDVFCVKGVLATGASNMLRAYTPPYSATSVRKLDDAGYVLMGKTNTDEFTMGGSTESSAFGVTKNPFDGRAVAGGSSGGSASAVATHQALFALGTDTGGSIRQPAAFCGVVGLKPTYGLVSRFGVMSMASSLDTIGPITKTVEDAALVLEAIAGNDSFDATTSSRDVPRYSTLLDSSMRGYTVGIPKEYDMQGVDGAIIKGFDRAKELLKDLGVLFKEVSLPHTEYALATYYIIVPAEVSSNLARYDGIKYGSTVNAPSLKEHYMMTRGHGFGVEAKRRIMVGTYALSKGYYDEYYVRAQKVRSLIRQDFEQVFKEVDMLMAPVSPFLPFGIGEKVEDPLKMYLADIFTVSANLAGIPALSMPVYRGETFPVSVQLMGPHFSEEKILRLGSHIERTRGPLITSR